MGKSLILEVSKEEVWIPGHENLYVGLVEEVTFTLGVGTDIGGTCPPGDSLRFENPWSHRGAHGFCLFLGKCDQAGRALIEKETFPRQATCQLS